MIFRKIHLDLEPQNKDGKRMEMMLSWFAMPRLFAPDESFCNSGLKRIVAVLRNRLVFDSKVTVDEARKMQKFVPLPNPCEVATEFFDGWNSFWFVIHWMNPSPKLFSNGLSVFPTGIQ